MNTQTLDVENQGQIVAQYRKARKWSQQDLAEALRIDLRTVQRMEKQQAIKNSKRRRFLSGLLGIPANLIGLDYEKQHSEADRIIVSPDRMAFFEQEMIARWELYHMGGARRAVRDLDMWMKEITSFAQAARGSAWHTRTLALLGMSYQLQGMVARDLTHFAFARDTFQQAYRVARELDDSELMASALLREGFTFFDQEQALETIPYLTGALDIIGHSGYSRFRGQLWGALSEVYAKTQQPQEAWRSVGLADRVLGHRESMSERSDFLFRPVPNIAQRAINAALLSDHRRALALIEKSLSIYDSMLYDPMLIRGRAKLLIQKATAYYGLGEIDACVATSEEALTTSRLLGSSKKIIRLENLYTTLSQSRWSKEPSVGRLGELLSI